VGSLEKTDLIIKKTIEKIKSGDIEINRITKTVLVIDEAQDMDEDEFNLIKVMMEQNEEMRVIAVGDDDQNIFEFRGSDSKYLSQLLQINEAVKYELVENYRSKNNLVEFTNQFAKRIHKRLKNDPVIAKQNDDGDIKIVQYKSNNLITPIVNDILATDLIGSTCVLTKTNEEALQIAGLLTKNKISAKLIQTNEGFNLYNILEIRYFIGLLNLKEDVYVINDEVWENAKRELKNVFRNSKNFEIVTNLILNFEDITPKVKYKSDFEIFIRESKIEDFYSNSGDTILVSTIHKAKGKEFDNIFLLLENFSYSTDSDRRLLYVALTRAKNNIAVHINSNQFESINYVENLVKYQDVNVYEEPKEIRMQLGLKDVWLDYFINRQYLISKLLCGDKLILNNDECLNANKQSVLKFSKQFIQRIEEMNSLGYELKSSSVNFIVYWKKEDAEQEVKIILPEVNFEKI
jgi:ATP-dependent DNA helicase RecQ